MRRILATGAALLLGGCGVDYQKCEAIKGALDSAYADAKMTTKARSDEIEENYLLENCGVKPENKNTDAYLSYLGCAIPVLEKNVKQISKQTMEAPDVVAAVNRTDEIAKDLKWNRCK